MSILLLRLSSFLSSTRRFMHCDSGTAMLEAVFVLPIALALLAGGVECGRLLSAYGTANKSMRSAARYLAHVPNNSTSELCGWGIKNAKNLAVYGKTNPANNDEPLIQNWTVEKVTLQSPRCPLSGNVSIVELTAAVPHTAIMFHLIGLPNQLTINVKHQERYIGE